jgi:hypothetical protein
VDDRAAQRAKFIPAVARAFRGRDFQTEFGHHSASTHTQHIIVVLPDDAMGYVFDHLRDDAGIVVLADTEGHLHIAEFERASAARIEVAREDDTMAQIHRDAPVVMLFAYLREVNGPVVIEQVSARLLADTTLSSP